METFLYSTNFYQTYCVPGTVLGSGKRPAHNPEGAWRGVLARSGASFLPLETQSVAKEDILVEQYFPLRTFSEPSGSLSYNGGPRRGWNSPQPLPWDFS